MLTKKKKKKPGFSAIFPDCGDRLAAQVLEGPSLAEAESLAGPAKESAHSGVFKRQHAPGWSWLRDRIFDRPTAFAWDVQVTEVTS